MKINLRTYVALIFALIIIMLSAVLSVTISKQSSATVKREIGNNLSTTAFHMADKLDSFMWSRIGEIQVLSKIKEIHSPTDIPEAESLLNQLQKNIHVFSWMGFTDTEGNVLAATGGILKGENVSNRPVYQEGSKDLFVGDVHNAVLLANLLPNPSGEPMQFVDISMPLINADGKKTGVLAAHLSWEWSRQVEKEIVSPLKDEMQGAEVVIVSKTDDTVILGPKNLIGTPLHLESIELARKGENNWLLETWPDGKRYLTGYANGNGHFDYKGLGWTVIVRIPETKAFAPVENLKHTIMLIGVLASIFFAFIGWLLAGFISKPLQRISHSAHRLQNGENVSIPDYKGISDLELLSYSLRSLIQSLVKTEMSLDKMESLAHHDHLTSLGNRVALDHFLKNAVMESKHTESIMSFLYLDLDGFKNINDTYGHQAGDLLLQQVARRLKDSLRSDDAIFRLGGDEFLIILNSSISSAEKDSGFVASKLIRRLNAPFEIMDSKIEIGCSVGAAIWPQHDSDPFTVMRYADEALYLSKKSGKNKFTFKPGSAA